MYNYKENLFKMDFSVSTYNTLEYELVSIYYLFSEDESDWNQMQDST